MTGVGGTLCCRAMTGTISDAMSDVFVTRRIPDAGLALLVGGGASIAIGQEDDQSGLDRAILLAGARGARVLLPLVTERIDREVLEQNPRLRGVANHGVGFDNVDVAAETELGIPVSNTPSVLTEATADLTWALLLAVARRIPEADAFMRAGRFKIWGPTMLLGADVGPGPDGRRKVLGIVGFGRIGREVARRASTWTWSRTTPSPRSWRRQGRGGWSWMRCSSTRTSSACTRASPPRPGISSTRRGCGA